MAEYRGWFRHQIARQLYGQPEVALTNESFQPEDYFEDVTTLGLYLHIPFCRQICPYCPYNKELFREAIARRYAEAMHREIEQYSAVVGKRPITSLYIGGGTPTSMLGSGLPGILEHVYQAFNMQCGIHIESHPNDLDEANLDTLAALGVDHLSIGVEALQDDTLRLLGRPYTASTAREAVERAVSRGFRCVNVDLIFALPGQTREQLQDEARTLIDAGVGQVATYPLFSFPYTRWPQLSLAHRYPSCNLLQKRRLLRLFEEQFYSAGFTRSSVWAFTRAGVPRYCSVTVPIYLGLGASGASYLPGAFYINTFNAGEYIRVMHEGGRFATALSLKLSRRMQMAGWLYWRIYETHFDKRQFAERFGESFDAVYGSYTHWLARLGWLVESGECVTLTDAGSYWLHAIQDLFSLDYVSTLWGTSRTNPWPQKVVLS